MNAVLSETVLSLADAAGEFRVGGYKPCWRTILRWTRAGRNVKGRTVRLGSARLGARVVTSVEACRRFNEELTVAHAGGASPPARTRTRWERDQAAALEALRRRGVPIGRRAGAPGGAAAKA